MPSLLEDIGRNRRGVQVYSPTRQLRSSPMANAGTARRLMRGNQEVPSSVAPMGGGMRQMGRAGGIQAPQMGQATTAAPRPMTTLDSLLAKSQQDLAQRKAAEPQGWQKALGTAVNSPIGQAVMMPLNVLDIPRRVVVSTVNELADAFNAGDTDIGDWFEQVKDPNFGFGNVIGSTGNIWADRFIGFTGDVLLDPLTYVAGSSVFAGTGRAARAGSAARAVAEGFTNDVTRSLGRFGYSHIDNTTRASLRAAGHVIEDAGYRFKLPGMKRGLRIPGTGRMEQATGKFGAKLRQGINETVPGMSRLRRWRAPDGLEDAYETLLTGRGPMHLTVAAEAVNFDNVTRLAGRTARSRLAAESKVILGQHSDEELTEMIHVAEAQGGTVLNEWGDRVADMAEAAGVKMNRRKNHVSHQLTPGAAEWLRGDAPEAVAIREALNIPLHDIDEVSPFRLERKLVARPEKPYDINGKEFHIKEGTIKEWNEEFARLVPDADFKFFDDNWSSIVARYIVGVSEDIGIVTAAKHLAQSKSGLVRGFSDEGATEEVIDEVLNTLANEVAADQLRSQLRSSKDLIGQMQKETFEGVSGIQGVLGVHMREALDDLQTVSDDTRLRLGALLVHEQELASARGVRAPGEIGPIAPGQFEAEFNDVIAGLDEHIDDLDNQLNILARRAAAEDQIYREARGQAQAARATDPDAVRQLYETKERLLAARVQAERDVQTLWEVRDRVKQHQLVQDIIARNADNLSFLSLAAGQPQGTALAPMRPGEVRSPSGEYRYVGTKEVVEGSATQAEIRRHYQARRNALMGNDPKVTEHSVRIELLQDRLERAEEHLAHVAERDTALVEAARQAVEEVGVQEALLGLKLRDLEGPALWEARAQVHRERKALWEGPMKEAKQAYEDLQRPLMEARTDRNFVRKQLETAKRKQEEAALGTTRVVAPTPQEMGPLAGPPEPLPHNPQTAGRAEAQLRKDEAALRAFEDSERAVQGPPIQQAREAAALEKSEIDQVVRTRLNNQYSPWKLDENGNLIPSGESYTGSMQKEIRARDKAYDDWQAIEYEVERLETHAARTFGEETPELDDAWRRRDAARKKFEDLDRVYVRDSLSQYRGTAMEAKLRETQAMIDRSRELSKHLDDLKTRAARNRREIKPVEDRIARNRQILDENAAVAKRNVDREQLSLNPPERPQPITLQERLRQLDADEKDSLGRAKRQTTYKEEWEPVEQVVQYGRTRAVPYSDRMYIEGRHKELGVDDEFILREAYKMLRDADELRIMGRFEDITWARNMIADIEGRRGPGFTNRELATIDVWDDAVDTINRINQARMTFGHPQRGSPEWEALMKSKSGGIGGSQTISHRANETLHLVGSARGHADELAAAGALNASDLDEMDRIIKELDYQRRVYDGDLLGPDGQPLVDKEGVPLGPSPTPQTARQLDHLISEAGRWGELVYRYKAALDAGVAPSDGLASFILVRVLENEDEVVQAQLRDINKQIATSQERWSTAYDAALAGGKNEDEALQIAEQASMEHRFELDNEADLAIVREAETEIASLDRQFEETGNTNLADQKQRAEKRIYAAKGRINKRPRPTSAYIDQEVQAFVTFLENEVIRLDNVVTDYGDARYMTKQLDWPQAKRAELEATIPHWAGQLEEMKAGQRRRRLAITKARNAGQDQVSYTPFEWHKIELPLDQAEETLEDLPDHLQAGLKAAIERARSEGKTTVMHTLNPGQGQRFTVPVAEAERQLKKMSGGRADRLRAAIKRAKDGRQSSVTFDFYPARAGKVPLTVAESEVEAVERSITSLSMLVDNKRLQLSVLDGSADIELQRLNSVIADAAGPPDIAVLQSRLDRLNAKPHHSPGDIGKMNTLQQRIHAAENPMSGEDLAELTAKRDRIKQAIDVHEEHLGADRIRLNAVIDGGQDFLQRLIISGEPPTPKEVQVLVDLFDPEGAEAASWWIQTFHRYLGAPAGRDKSQPITEEDLLAALGAMERDAGDNALSEQIVRNLSGYDAMGEQITFDHVVQELHGSMTAAARGRFQNALRDFGEMFDRMGLKVPPNWGLEGNSKLQAMGYTMSKQKLNRSKMEQFVIEQFKMQGFDPTSSLRDRKLTLQLRSNRLRTMQRGLGKGMRERPLSDPEAFFRWMYGEAEPGSLDSALAAAGRSVEDDLADTQVAGEIFSEGEDLAAQMEPEIVETAAGGRTIEEVEAEIMAAMDNYKDRPEQNAHLEALNAEADAIRAGHAPTAGEPTEGLDAFEEPGAAVPVEMPEMTPELDSALKANTIDRQRRLAEMADRQREFRQEHGVHMTPEQQAEHDAIGLEYDELSDAVPPAVPGEMQALDARGRELDAKSELTDDEQFELNAINNRLTELENAGIEPMTPEEIMAGIEGAPTAEIPDEAMAELEEGGAAREMQERDLSPEAYEQLRAYEARVEGRRGGGQIDYNWRTIISGAGSPRNTISARVERTPGKMGKQVGALTGTQLRPSGQFTYESLPTLQARAEQVTEPLQAERGRLMGVSQQRGEEIEQLQMEEGMLEEMTSEAAEGIESTLVPEHAAAAGYIGGADVEAERLRVAEANAAEQKRLSIDRANAGLAKMRAEQQYTDQLNAVDMDLGQVRTAVAAAHTNLDYLDNMHVVLKRALETHPESLQDLTPLLEDLRQANAMRTTLEAGVDRFGQTPFPTPIAPDTGAIPMGPVINEIPDDLGSIRSVEAMINSAIDAQMKQNNEHVSATLIEKRLEQWDKGEALVNDVVQRVVRDGWKPLAAAHLSGPDALVGSEALVRALGNLKREMDSKGLWKQVERYTAFFKTYATATPGFHVRNALSGIFMNISDGVRMRHIARAPGMWHAFRADPSGFWEKADDRTRRAFEMVFGSGAGGQFTERGVGPVSTGGGRAYQRVMNNTITRWNKGMGEYVEGPIRLAMALDSVDRGMSTLGGLDRISRIHFDYNQVSKMDRKAKQLIPFWTFMSRNLPLQITQMWTHPRTYLHYQSLVRNFGEAADPLTPEYWLAQGAFTMNQDAKGTDSPWYLSPDLPHLRMAEPFNAAAQGDWGKALLSDINPAVLAPIESFVTKQKTYTGRPIEGYSAPEGAMKLFTPLFQLLGATETGGTSGETLVAENYQHLLRSLIPPVQLAERLTSESGPRAGRQDETVLRALGAPVYQLTPELRQSTQRSKAGARRAKLRSQAELARS